MAQKSNKTPEAPLDPSLKVDVTDQIKAETIAPKKIWLLVACDTRSAIVDLNDCVTPPELKIGTEVVEPNFGSGTLIALSVDKQELETNKTALCKTYRQRLKRAQKMKGEAFHPVLPAYETAEIHLNDLMSTQQSYKKAIYEEIQFSVYSPVMNMMTDELVGWIYCDDSSDDQKDDSEKKEKGEGSEKETDPEENKTEVSPSKNEEESEGNKKESEDTLEREQSGETQMEKKEKEEEQEKEKNIDEKEKQKSETELKEKVEEKGNEEEEEKEKEKEKGQGGKKNKNRKKKSQKQ